MFVIQEHHARALHWDFRLERDGVLVSWAIPKGLPLDKKTNHLAVHTEDHPLEYATFEGTIPEGEYGGGKVSIWDSGTYDELKWSDREVMVILHGRRMQGTYVLFATKDSRKEGNGAASRAWMIHRMDDAPEGYTPLPRDLRPMLATLGMLPSDDESWAYEFKWDGVRALSYVDGGRIHVASRNGNDLTASFPELRAVGEQLGSRQVVLDGEIVALDQLSKIAIERGLALDQRISVLPVLEITRLHNTGAAFSFLADAAGWQRWLFVALALIVSTVLAVWLYRMPRGAAVLASAVHDGRLSRHEVRSSSAAARLAPDGSACWLAFVRGGSMTWSRW